MKKTEILDFPYYVSENLEKVISSYREVLSVRPDTSSVPDLMSLFNSFLILKSPERKVRFVIFLKA